MTTTNFRVEQQVRGTLPATVQIDEKGARQDKSFPCWQWAYQVLNDPLPEVGHQYVLFAQSWLGGARYEALWRSADRFEVVSGTVHSLLDFFPEANLTFSMQPEQLAKFIADVQRQPSPT
jgi:hypothetical protein